MEINHVRFGRLALMGAGDGPRIELRQLLGENPSPLPAAVQGGTPVFSGNNLVVGDFAKGNRTPLGGYFGTYQREPSVAEALLRRSSDGRRTLELTCSRGAGGFCGLWIQCYDSEALPGAKRFLDARPFSTFSFWIRGRVGGEGLLLKIADAEWEQREDALPVGELGAFLPSGRVETEWQQAVVPMDRFPTGAGLDRMALILFEVLDPGATAIELGAMALSILPEPLPPLPSPTPAPPPPIPVAKATWVWDTAELMQAPDRMISLFDFLETEGFDHVFLQLPAHPGPIERPGELHVDVEAMRPILAALNDRGMRVYALDGSPRYALPEFHEGVLVTLDHVAAYNRAVHPEERFYGVRHDIEPYLLPSFHGPNRDRILVSLLQLTEASARKSRSAGLVYGADIPFWYDAPSEDSHERVTVSFRGLEKTASEHIIDLVDDVSIMDYRTTAFGSDGTIRHGLGEVEYAARVGKRVFIGLETLPVPDEVLLDFGGAPEVGIRGPLPPGPLVVLGANRDSLFVALLEGSGAPSGALESLKGWLGEHRSDPEAVHWWPLRRRVEVPAKKVSFAHQDPEKLMQVMRGTAEEFLRYGSFAGFAIHSAEAYRALVSGSGSSGPTGAGEGGAVGNPGTRLGRRHSDLPSNGYGPLVRRRRDPW